MAKIRSVIGNAVLEAEGTEAACADASRMFHLLLTEHALRDVDQRLQDLKPLRKQRRDLIRRIAQLSVKPSATVQ